MKKILAALLPLAILAGGAAMTSAKPAKTPPQPDTYAYTRGVEAFNDDKNDEAFEWFSREVKEHPDNGYAYAYIGTLYAGNEQYGNALSALNKAMKLIPKKDAGWRATTMGARGAVYLQMADTVQALEDMEAALKIDPEQENVLTRRANIYYEMGKYDLSDADFRRLSEIDPGQTMGYMGVGRNAYAQKRYDDAIKEYDKAIRLSPNYANAYSFRAQSYVAQEKWNEAADDIVKALDLEGDDKSFYLMQDLRGDGARILMSKLKLQMAMQPTNVYWPYCLGTMAQANEDYQDAIKWYLKANEMDANPAFLEAASKAYLKLYRYQDALDCVNRALSMNPDDSDLYDLKGDILAAMGRYDEALAERNRSIEATPGWFGAYMNRAGDLLDAGRPGEAAEDYEMASTVVDMLNQFPSFLMRRGDAYRLSAQKQKADADYEALLTLERDSAKVARTCSPFALTGLGRYEEGIELMRYIVDNDTADRPGNLYNLGCAYMRSGLPDEAIVTLREAVAAGYDNASHMRHDYDLHPLHGRDDFMEIVESIAPASGETPEGEDATEWSYETVEIPFTKENGVTKVKCTINGLPLHFVFDTGAADVTLSMVEANFMLKNDYIKPSDIIGSARYVDANGDISEGTVVNLRNVDFGGLELDNVRASVVRNQRAPLLLGQSVLGRLGKIEIDNSDSRLLITHRVRKSE